MALVGCITAVAAPQTGFAQEPNAANAANVAAARRHFEKARAFYGQGAYREAITELDAAHTLDPNAKDLVFNLGVVHEKLADIDEALKWFKLYTTMDLVPQERDRADAYIKRLEGAKRELEAKQAAPPQPSEPTSPGQAPGTEPKPQPPAAADSATHRPESSLPPPAPPPAAIGRIDALTIGGATLTTAALAFGIVMAVMSTGDRPPENLVTPRDLTYDQLRSRTDHAHQESLMADAGFGAALVCGVFTSYLYLGRSRAPAALTRSTTFLAGPLSNGRGGTLLLEGRF